LADAVMLDDYDAIVARKAFVSLPTGIEDPPELSAALKEHQRLLTRWSLFRGRAAVFGATGTGKTGVEVCWADAVSKHTGKPVLVLAPLAVSHQIAREALMFGVDVSVCSGAEDVRPGVNVTNYQKLHKFDVSVFGGVACDEASILKALDGSTRKLLIDSFRETPFRLAATATPAPNDYTELGGQAEFLGIMTHQEMLASFFIRDGGSTQDWRLKGHARDVFWKWVCSWGAIVNLPSDIGCSDEGYILPPLVYHEHIVPATRDDALKAGRLFADTAQTLNEQRAARRGTLDSRVAIAARIASETTGPVIVWCDLNSESEALTKAIPGAVEVTGSMSDDEKEAAIARFVNREARVIVSKAVLMGWGLNLQFARTQVFCGVSHSFEALHQAVRRSWRYGVDGDVHIHLVSSELEGAVLENVKRKMREAEELAAETKKYVSDYVRSSVTGLTRETIAYNPTCEFEWPAWLKTEEAA
jgi:superfamily II DNA or RNA helicase